MYTWCVDELWYLITFINSRQLAEEVLKGKREDGEEEVVEEAGGGFEGMEALTRAIETGKQRREGGENLLVYVWCLVPMFVVLLRVQISLTDTIINVSYSPLHNQNRESFLSLKVDKYEVHVYVCMYVCFQSLSLMEFNYAL